MQQASAPPLITLPFSYAGGADQRWTVEYIEHLRSAEPESRDLRPYQDAALRKALKSGAKKQTADDHASAPATSWESLIRRAVEPVQPRPIGPLGPEFLAGALALRESDSHREGRGIVGRLLDEVESMHWKGWGNPFKETITPENCIELGVPDYFKIIKKGAKGLDEMRRCLNNQPFYGLPAFREDFDLMIANSLEFNREGDPVHGMALQLNEKYKVVLKAAKVERVRPDQGAVGGQLKRPRVG